MSTKLKNENNKLKKEIQRLLSVQQVNEAHIANLDTRYDELMTRFNESLKVGMNVRKELERVNKASKTMRDELNKVKGDNYKLKKEAENALVELRKVDVYKNKIDTLNNQIDKYEEDLELSRYKVSLQKNEITVINNINDKKTEEIKELTKAKEELDELKGLSNKYNLSHLKSLDYMVDKLKQGKELLESKSLYRIMEEINTFKDYTELQSKVQSLKTDVGVQEHFIETNKKELENTKKMLKQSKDELNDYKRKAELEKDTYDSNLDTYMKFSLVKRELKTINECLRVVGDIDGFNKRDWALNEEHSLKFELKSLQFQLEELERRIQSERK